MLLFLLALFSNFNIGQLQSDYKDVFTRVITHEANAQEVAHKGRLRTVESATVFTVTLPPLTQRSYKTIQLKPTVRDISLPTIIHNTRMMPNELEKTIYAGGPTYAFDIAAPPQKIQLNIAQETITLKPKISVADISLPVITYDTRMMPTEPEKTLHAEESTNAVDIAAPPPKIQFNIAQETIRLKPKISAADISLPTVIHDTRMMPTEPEKTLHAEESTNAVDIAAPPPKIQLNIAQETIRLKPKISVADISLPTVIHNTRMMPTEPEKTLHVEESTNAVDIAAPPPKIQPNIAQENITLKPKISVADISLPTIIHNTRMMPTEMEKTIYAGAPTYAFDIAAPPPKIQFNIAQETTTPTPKMSVTDISLPAITYDTRMMPTELEKTPHAEGSTNAVDIAAPPPKIQFNIAQETITLKPKISVADISLPVITYDTRMMPTEPEKTLHAEESTNAVDIAAPPPKIQFNIAQETIRLKPKISAAGISLPTVIHDTRMMPTEPEKTLHAEESTNAVDIAAPPPKIQFNIAQETIRLKPKISAADISLPTVIHDTRMMPTEPEKTLHAEESTNAVDIAAPPPKIQFNIAQETIRLKPKISAADISLPTVIHETRMMPTEPEKTLLAEESTNAVDIAAPPPKIQFNIAQETTTLKPKISNVFTQSVGKLTPEAKEVTPGADVHKIEPEANLPTGGSAVVINPAVSKPEVTYEIPEIDNPIKTQPQTIEEPVNNDNYNQVAEQPAKLESQGEPDINALNQHINVGDDVKPEPDVKVDHKIIVDNRKRVSVHQQKGGETPHKSHKKGAKKPTHAHEKRKRPVTPYKPHKKGTKKPTHAHEKPKRPVKEKTSTIEFNPNVVMIKQDFVHDKYHVKPTGGVSGHKQKGRKPKPPRKPHKKGTKIPTHAHGKPKRPVKEKTLTIEFDPNVVMIKQELVHGNYRVKPTSGVSGHQQKGRKPKPPHKPHKPHKKGTEIPTHAHEKPKRPVKEKTSTIEFDPNVVMIKQELVHGNYRVKPTSGVSGHQQKGRKPKPPQKPHKPHKKGTKIPTHAHGKPKRPVKEKTLTIEFDPNVVMIKQDLVHRNHRVKPTSGVSGHQQKGRKPKPPQKPHKPHKKGTKIPTHAHGKPKRPVKEKTSTIEFDPNVVMIKQELVHGNYRVKSRGDRVSGHQRKGGKPRPPHKPHTKCTKKPTHVHEKLKRPMKEKISTIAFDRNVVMIKQELVHGNYRVKSRGDRVSGHQRKGGKPRPPHKPHTKCTKKPTHVHEKLKRPMKEKISTIAFDRNVVMIKQELVHGNYRVKSRGDRVSEHQRKGGKPRSPHKPHTKCTKKPTHVHEKLKRPMKEKISTIAFDPNVVMIRQELVHDSYHVTPTVDINVGRKTKLTNGGTRVPAHGRNFVIPQKCANKKCMKCKKFMQRPNGHKHKKEIEKPHKVYNIRIEEQTKIRIHGPEHFLRPIKTKSKKNPNRHRHLAMPKKVNPNKMKHPPSPKKGPSKCQCKTCRAKLAQKTDHSARIRISAQINGRKPAPKTKIAHEKRIKKPLTLKNVLTANIKLRHDIRILRQEKVHIQAKPKQHSPRPVIVTRYQAKAKKHPSRSVNVIHHPKTVRPHAKPKIVRHPNISAHKRVQGKVRKPPPRKRVIKGCGCQARKKRHILSKTRYSKGESGTHAIPAANVDVDLRPKRGFAESLHVSEDFVHSRLRHTPSQNHDLRSRGSSAETKHSESSHNSVSLAAAGSLQFDNWQVLGTCEYMVRKNARNYDNAEKDCQALDAHLVSIHSEPENNFIHKITSTGSRIEMFEDFVWIGLRMNSQNQWEWVDGSPLDYSKWAVNQPDHSDEKRCAQLYQGPAKLIYVQDYHWNSFRCDRPMKYYVCKRCKRPARVRQHT